METIETYLVNNTQAAEQLGVGKSYISALKKVAGCGGSHRFKMAWLLEYLEEHPNFRVRDGRVQADNE
jgi:hypothetical protein